MSNIIINAPVQNKAFLPDLQLGKIIPIYAANYLRTNETDLSSDVPVELWNNVLASEESGHTVESYLELMRARLVEKYSSYSLSHLHNADPSPLVLTDTDTGFVKWATNILEKSMSQGTIVSRKIGVWACQNCCAAISVAKSPQPQGCMNCPSTVPKIVEQVVLTCEISDNTKQAVLAATGLNSSTFNCHTGLTIINKRRIAGVSLKPLGFENDVLDPRVGLGLLALYAATLANADIVKVVASRSTLSQNLANFYAAIGQQKDALPNLRMIGIAKAPANYLLHLTQTGLVSHPHVLEKLSTRIIPKLFTMKNDMKPAQAEQLIFSKRASY